MAAKYDPRQKDAILGSSGTGQDAEIQKERKAGEKLQGQKMMEQHNKETIFYDVKRADHPEIRDHWRTTNQQVEEDDDEDSLDSDDLAFLNDAETNGIQQSAFRELRADLIREEEMEQKKKMYKLEGVEERRALEIGANNEYVVLNFEHMKFQRTHHLSWHLNEMAPKYPDTKFIAVDVQQSPFLVEKFKIKTLPSMVILVRGKLQDKIIGFDDFGGDEFSTNMVIRRLRQAGVVPDSTGKYLKKAPRTNTMMQ